MGQPFKPKMTPISVACAVCLIVGYMLHGCMDVFDERCVDGAVEVHRTNGDGSSSWYDTGQECKCTLSKDDCNFFSRAAVYPGKG